MLLLQAHRVLDLAAPVQLVALELRELLDRVREVVLLEALRVVQRHDLLVFDPIVYLAATLAPGRCRPLLVALLEDDAEHGLGLEAFAALQPHFFVEAAETW